MLKIGDRLITPKPAGRPHPALKKRLDFSLTLPDTEYTKQEAEARAVIISGFFYVLFASLSEETDKGKAEGTRLLIIAELSGNP